MELEKLDVQSSKLLLWRLAWRGKPFVSDEEVLLSFEHDASEAEKEAICKLAGPEGCDGLPLALDLVGKYVRQTETSSFAKYWSWFENQRKSVSVFGS